MQDLTEEITQEKFAPTEIERSNLFIEPIPPEYPRLITQYGDKNYLNKGNPHYAIDIFTKPYTPVVAPEDGYLCHKGYDPLRELTDIALLGKSGTLYRFLHLDSDSVHSLLNNTYGVNNLPKELIKQGEQIGKVGKWPQPIYDSDKQLLEEVNSNGSHLHLAIYKRSTSPITMDDIPFNFLELINKEYSVDPQTVMQISGKVLHTN